MASSVESRMKQGIAIFDYDNTLVKGDSLWPFLVTVAGLWPTLAAFSKAVVKWPCVWARKGDTRTYVKKRVLKELLANRRVDDLAPALEKIRAWPRLKTVASEALRDHSAKGHHIVIASGGLDLYLPALLSGMPYDALICTKMEVIDGKVTGEMASGNCVRKRKAEYLKTYLEAHGPFDDSWGYGNAPHDLPMLQLVNHATVIH